nr:hypothetical protein Itr_chr12CG15860 [Ipomoea trifida]
MFCCASENRGGEHHCRAPSPPPHLIIEHGREKGAAASSRRGRSLIATLRRSPHAADHPHLLPLPQAKTGGGTKSVAALHVADVQDRRERNGESAVG